MSRASRALFAKQAASTAAPAGQVQLYVDADGALALLDEAGTSTPVKTTSIADLTDAGSLASQNANAVALTGGSVRVTSGLGYNTGAGAAQTQTTNKATTVTCDGWVCFITMSSASLTNATTATFTLNNNKIPDAYAQLIVTHHSGGTAGAYSVGGRSTGAGTGSISVTNRSGGSLSEAIVLMVTVLTGANS